MDRPKCDGRQRKSALLLRCTVEEAEMIRDAAQLEGRTISGFILDVLAKRIAAQHRSKQAGGTTSKPTTSRCAKTSRFESRAALSAGWPWAK